MNTIHNPTRAIVKALTKVVPLLLLLAAPAFSQSVVQITSLNSLPESIQNDINQLCLPSQYRDGAAAYRKCVAKQIELRNSDSAILMDNYSFDEKYAIQMSCGGEVASSEKYLTCVSNETTKLDAIPVPEFNDLTEDEQSALQLSCYDAQKFDGAASYRQCINIALQNQLSIPRTDISQLSSVEQNQIKLNCTNASRQKADSNYRLCIAESFADILKTQRDNRASSDVAESVSVTAPVKPEPALVTVVTVPKTDEATDLNNLILDKEIDQDNVQSPTVQVTSLTSTANPDSGVAVNKLIVTEITKPEPIVEIMASARAETQIATQAATGTEAAGQNSSLQQPLSQFTAFRNNPLEFLRNLDMQQYSHYLKLLLPIVVMLIALKLLAMLLRRRKRNHVTAEQHYIPAESIENSFDDEFSDYHFENTHQQATKPVDLSNPFTESDTALGKSAAQPDLTHDPDFTFLDDRNESEFGAATGTESNAALLDQTLHTPIYSESEFGHWLHQQPVENHKRLCTEFMLYWVSYGDGNYTPEHKEELLRAVDLNEHDLIKKWVLEQNPSTLVDMLQRVWSIFSKAEVEQTISMMFAVLVKNEISPVQNTFFRFLADFAHIGSEGLNQLHMDSFGTGLPPLPRPDDERWWQRQIIAESQAVANSELLEQSDYEICLSLLGLSDPAGPTEIKNAYAQIANRCNPARFELLGEKERDLVQRHLGKYTQAYEYLLELNQ